ncbi:MAG TPA: hypothetical protein VFG04_23225 [Planctomycetaceae bacterium]|jgi:hypothetical protein|nr:hypothetical protein [Planctomycetaceae bacterium]
MSATLLHSHVLDEPRLDEPTLEAPANENPTEGSHDWALARARSGAAWLDAKYGSDWDRHIDFDRVEIGSPFWCIVGQLIRHGYLSMLFATQIVDHGFSRGLLDVVIVLLPIGPVKQAYRPLTDAWKTVLRERRGPTEPHVKPAKVPVSTAARLRRAGFTQAV